MSFTKHVAHSDGTVTKDTVECYFGLPSGQPTQEGDVEQAISVYVIRFGNSERSM